ncbi:hypothetical protein RU639_013008 [Aspergillus parasiticus]
MDIFQTSVTTIHEICRVTIFIRKMVQEIRSYEDNISYQQTVLDHEFVFLEAFRKLFFDSGSKEIRQLRLLPHNLTRSVNNILTALNQCLAEYRVIALKHGLDFSEAEMALADEQRTPAATAPCPPASPADKQTSDRYRDRLRAAIATLAQRGKAPEWALFSKAKVEALVAQYSQWTERLRQVMTLILLVEGRVGSLTVNDIAMRGTGAALGLQRTAERQIRAKSDAPNDFDPLDGSIEACGGPIVQSSGDDCDVHHQYEIGKYTDAFGVSSIAVIIEKHIFDIFDASTSISERSKIRLAMVRDLAWMLKEGDVLDSLDTAQNGGNTASAGARGMRKSYVNLLQCLGYFHVAEDGYPSLIYKLPAGVTGTSICSLHDYILSSPKPALGDRFKMALTLASTVLNVHSSGWVHKNIWSRGILFIPTEGRPPALYLQGWSVARPRSEDMSTQSMGTSDRSITGGYSQLEPELYRHPERYGSKVAGFTAKHDLYSVGIVLLEIALWTTMSKQFAGPISKTKVKKALPPVSLVSEAVAKLSRDVRVAQEMGTEYACLIRRCLQTDFEVEEHDEQESGLLGQFQALVIDRLSMGVIL